jgi:glyoxylase-like metal-dependent hydrolase (beta-lactamase superfamily II)
MSLPDAALDAALTLVRRRIAPEVRAFFDPATFTVSYVVKDPSSNACAIVDSVLDFDPASGRTSHAGADKIVDFVRSQALRVEWILETHAHADHLSGAPYLQAALGGRIAIGAEIVSVQKVFGALFALGADFAPDGRQFDHLFRDGERFTIGGLEAVVLHTPGHTPACLSYVIGDAVFVGDTLFMPDYGTARCDFPGGDAATLFASVQRLLALPDETRMFLCHDYLAPGRNEYRWETTVGEQREHNVQIRRGVSQGDFVSQREARDATLAMPRLILPAVQINIRAGRFPEPEANGVRYLKLPLDVALS